MPGFKDQAELEINNILNSIHSVTKNVHLRIAIVFMLIMVMGRALLLSSASKSMPDRAPKPSGRETKSLADPSWAVTPLWEGDNVVTEEYFAHGALTTLSDAAEPCSGPDCCDDARLSVSRSNSQHSFNTALSEQSCADSDASSHSVLDLCCASERSCCDSMQSCLGSERSYIDSERSDPDPLAASFGMSNTLLLDDPSMTTESIQESLVPDAAELGLVAELRERAQADGLAAGIAGGDRWYEDGELLRYIRARPTVDDALQLLREAMAWRHEHAERWGVDVSETASFGAVHAMHLMQRGDLGPPEWWTFLQAHMPLDVFGEDRDGLPISYFALGSADLQGLVREVGLEALRQYCVYQNDYFFDAARTATKQAGVLLLGGIVIIDMDGLTWMDAKTKVQLCSAMVEQARHLHPERQRRCFVVRAPRCFSVIWSLASSILDPRTVAKITILSASDSPQPMIDELGANNVPDFLGGTCTSVAKRPLKLSKGAFNKFKECYHV